MTVAFPLTFQKRQDPVSESNLTKDIKMEDV